MATNNSIQTQKDGKNTQTIQMVGFTVGNEEFCVDILKVQEIIRMVKITHIPSSQSYVEGLINLRGKVIPVIDFRKKMNFSDDQPIENENRRIVVVSFGLSLVGLIVDKVSHVMKIASDQISSTPEVIKGYNSECLMGVGKVGEKLVVLLDLDKMFQEDSIAQVAIAA